jgi:hypothetical protein
MPSRNEPCPCGSGKKFKKCCYAKQFSFQENEGGGFDKLVPMDDELAKLLSQHIESLGPDVSPDTPLFDKMDFERMEHSMAMAMKAAGLDPAIIYAFEETGMMISEENMGSFSQVDLDLWQSKIEEFRNGPSIDDDADFDESNTKFPLGTVAYYGPDDQQTTKIVVGVFLHANADPILRRFVSSKVKEDPKVQSEIVAFLGKYKVKQTVLVDENIGCPHEEGEDFPVGEDCPFCPFWAGKQGSSQ